MAKINIEKYNENIENVLLRFDFGKAHALFSIMGWTYFDSDQTPTCQRLEKTAKNLLKEAIKSTCNGADRGYCASGHFEATACGGELTLKLIFAEESEYYGA